MKDSSLCEICKVVVQEVDNLLSDNSTVAEIKTALDNLCHNIPLVGSLCQQVVDEYLNQIIQALENEFTPTQVCEQDLNLCSSVKAVSPKSEVSCELCEFAISEINSSLSDNATEHQIIVAVEKVCSILPKTIADQCDSFVEKYASLIVDFLKTESPEQICTMLDLCSDEQLLLKGKALGLGGE